MNWIKVSMISFMTVLSISILVVTAAPVDNLDSTFISFQICTVIILLPKYLIFCLVKIN